MAWIDRKRVYAAVMRVFERERQIEDDALVEAVRREPDTQPEFLQIERGRAFYLVEDVIGELLQQGIIEMEVEAVPRNPCRDGVTVFKLRHALDRLARIAVDNFDDRPAKSG